MRSRWMRRASASVLLASGLAATAPVGGLVAMGGAPAGAATNATQAWAATYVGGKAGPAHAGEAPFVIGAIEPVGISAGGFPELPATIHAAEDYINQQLGGVDGHPVKLDVCQVTDSQDGQQCGEQFANDPDVKIVVNGINFFDDTALLQALASKSLPVVLPLDATSAELSATQAANFGPGVPANYAAFAQYVVQNGLQKKPVAVIYPDNSAGLAGLGLEKQVFAAAHVTDITFVEVPPDGTAPQYTSALSAAGASQAPTVIEFGPDTMCVAAGDALKSLGITPKTVLVTSGCMDSLVLSHYGGTLPTNWRVFNYGNSPYVPTLRTGTSSYLAAMKQYAPHVDPGSAAFLMFSAIMTTDRLVNAVGYQNATSASLMKAMLAFTGPAFMSPGPMSCGYAKAAPSVCGKQVPVDRYTGKAYVESLVTVSS